jgi:hypothetical protein
MAKRKAAAEHAPARPASAESPHVLGAEWEARLATGESINSIYASETVAQAKARDPEAAREVLADFVGAINQYSMRTWSGPIEWQYARYVADCFAQILAGKDATRALNLTRKKGKGTGRLKGKTRTRDKEALGASWWFLIRQGLKPETATKRLSQETGADRRTIQRAAKEDGNYAYKWPQLVDDEALKAVVKPYAAIIARILAAE